MSSHFDVPDLRATAPGEDMEMSLNFDHGIDSTADEDIDIDLEVPLEDWTDQDPHYALEDVRSEIHATPSLNVDGQDDITYEEDEAAQGMDGNNQTLELADAGDLAHITAQDSSAASFEANGGVFLGDFAQQTDISDVQAARGNVPEASSGRIPPTSDGKAVAMNAEEVAVGGKVADTSAKALQDRGEVPERSHGQDTEATLSRPQRLHPVFVYYQNTDISLFPPSVDDAADTFFLQDSSLANASLSELFAAMRSVLVGTIREQDDLELAIDDLGLCINEDSIACQRKSLADLVKVWVDLNRHDGIEHPDPLYMSLSTKAGCGGRLKELIAAVTDGKGISNLHLWDDLQDDTANDEPAQARVAAAYNEGVEINGQSAVNQLLESEARDELHEDRPAASGPVTHDVVAQASSVVEQPADELVITVASAVKAASAVSGPRSDALQEPPLQTPTGSLQTGPSAKEQAELDRKSSRQVYQDADDEDLIDYEDDESLAAEGDLSRGSLSGAKTADAPDDETKPQDTATARQGASQVSQVSRLRSESLKYDLEGELDHDGDPPQEQAWKGQASGKHVEAGHTESYDASLATGELATDERNGTTKLAPQPQPYELQEQSIRYEGADDYDLNEDVTEKDPDLDDYDLNEDLAEKDTGLDGVETPPQGQEDYGQHPPDNTAERGQFDDSLEDDGPVELLGQPVTHEPNPDHGEQLPEDGYDDLDYSGDAVAGYELDTDGDLLPIDVDAELDLCGEDEDAVVQPHPSGSVGTMSEVTGVHASGIAPATTTSNKRSFPELGERIAHDAANQDTKRIRSA